MHIISTVKSEKCKYKVMFNHSTMQCQIKTSSPTHVSIVKCLNYVSTTDQVTYHLHTRATGHIAHHILSAGSKLDLLGVSSCLIAERFNIIRQRLSQ